VVPQAFAVWVVPARTAAAPWQLAHADGVGGFPVPLTWHVVQPVPEWVVMACVAVAVWQPAQVVNAE
jgi:hypothetical protein